MEYRQDLEISGCRDRGLLRKSRYLPSKRYLLAETSLLLTTTTNYSCNRHSKPDVFVDASRNRF